MSEAERPSTDSFEPSLARESLGFCSTLLDQLGTENIAATYRYPSAQETTELWNRYLSNVHPLSKLFFDWDKEGLFRKAGDQPQSLSKAEQAFAFAVYFITILSLSDVECKDVMSEPNRLELLDDFQHYVETALLAAGFVATSDLLVLQAFLIYLVKLSPTFHEITC